MTDQLIYKQNDEARDFIYFVSKLNYYIKTRYDIFTV